MYVETDFLLELAKPDDWLWGRAEAALDEHDPYTSIVAYAEFFLVADDYNLDRRRAVSNLLDLVPVKPEPHGEAVLRAAKYQQEKGLTPFDSVHAALAEPAGRLLGSNRAYEDLNLERVPLEAEADDA
jgi:predicted nucleic acid-binding protein